MAAMSAGGEAPESLIVAGETAPAYLIPCWVGASRGWGYSPGEPPRLTSDLCPDRIAEWWTTNGSSPQWRPTCTGCKDRFVRLNPDTIFRPIQ